MLDNTDLHTILRLPTGVFYAQGVKANVIFFDNREASPHPWTKQVWYYDYRTNIHHTLKKKPLRYEHLTDFIRCYHPPNRHLRAAAWHPQDAPDGRWRSYRYDEIVARDKTSLDLFWLKDESVTNPDDLPAPEDLAAASSNTWKPASTASARCCPICNRGPEAAADGAARHRRTKHLRRLRSAARYLPACRRPFQDEV